jgi:DNA-binding CsgD family transcriptional regulator
MNTLRTYIVNQEEASPFMPEDPFYMEAVYDIRYQRVVAASANCKTMVGYDLNFLLGRSAKELLLLLPTEDQPILLAILPQIGFFMESLPHSSKLTARISVEFRFAISAQSVKWLKLLCKPMVNEMGFVQSYKVDLYDITADKRDDKIQASSSYLDPMGKPCYHKFTHAARQFSELNQREKKILRLLADGLTSKEIAGLLLLSKDTIDKARKQMLAKTGAKNTVELVKRFMDMQP